MALADIKIKSLRGKERIYKAYDSDSLFLKVSPNGSPLWRLKYSFENKEKLLALGRYPEISLKEARTLAFKARPDCIHHSKFNRHSTHDLRNLCVILCAYPHQKNL